MKKTSVILLLLLATTTVFAAVKPIVFRGDTLTLNTEFTRTLCGSTPTYLMPEISGMSCSRVSPGYLWIQSDDNSRVCAMNEKGELRYVRLMMNYPSRRDWEGLGLGVYQGKSTVFVGGFGDNDLQYKNKYYIFYFEEPVITEKYKKDSFYVDDQYILYGYPDGKAHNTEALMYDNEDQKLYIVDKVEKNFCSVFSLRMDTVYGTDLQILTKECELGYNGERQFQRVTAADISPDGRWIIIKNNYYDASDNCYAYALIWHREVGETVPQALMRQPQQIAAYEVEWQGEAVAWLDSTTFYTTSDESDAGAPIYKYVRWKPADMPQVDALAQPQGEKMMVNGQIFIRAKEEEYTLSGQRK